jgi:hypothetical protein
MFFIFDEILISRQFPKKERKLWLNLNQSNLKTFKECYEVSSLRLRL